MNWGETAKLHRLNAGWTVKYMAHVTGLCEETIRAFEDGRRKTGLDKAVRIADALRISVDELIGHEVKKGERDD